MSASTTSTADVLRAAKDLISDPVKWIKGADALDARPVTGRVVDNSFLLDHEVHEKSDEAFCFCAGGAIQRVAPGSASASRALNAFAAVHHDTWPHEFNDHETTTHADVMATFDLAIAKAEARDSK